VRAEAAAPPRLDAPTANARARGLATHLLRRDELEPLAGLDARALGAALARTGRLEPIAEPESAATIEAAARKTAALHLGTLARWAAGAALEVAHAEHDRRATRALLRGAIAGTPSERRLAGLVPTPHLPERALVAIAREPTASRVAAHLVVLAYPGAPELLALATRAHPVPFELDLALLHALAARLAAAAHAGDANLREIVAARLDAINAVTALTHAGGPRDAKADVSWVDGGARLARDDFERASSEPARAASAGELARALGRSPLAAAMRASGGDPARFGRAAEAALLDGQRRRARLEPLSSAPVVWFLARLDAQCADVRRLAWGAALGAPAATIRAELATPWS